MADAEKPYICPNYSGQIIPMCYINRMNEQTVRVGISEASRLFGVSEKTIRRALQSGELRYIIVRNRYKISFQSLVAWSQKSIQIQRKRDMRGIGQWVTHWKIKNTKYSPRLPKQTKTPR